MAGTGLDQRRRHPGRRRRLETAIPGVFAAGDVARHDHPVFGPMRVEHFDNALKMGEHGRAQHAGRRDGLRRPALVLVGPVRLKIQMAGFAPTWDRMVVRGSLEDRSFCAFLLDDGGVRSIERLDRWPRDVRRSFGLIRRRCAPDPAALADPDVDLRRLVPDEG